MEVVVLVVVVVEKGKRGGASNVVDGPDEKSAPIPNGEFAVILSPPPSAFGGLHLAKALVNCFRNHILQYDGEFFGTNTLLSMKDESEILQNIKNLVFVGKDRQSDFLAYMTVSPQVQEALSMKKHTWVQRIPEKHRSFKSNAKSQKKIVLCVDVCSNRNGDLYILDAGAACVHVVDRSNVAAVRMIGTYNSPNLDPYRGNKDEKKNVFSKIRLSNTLLDICIDNDDNLYVADGGRTEVIIIPKCLPSKILPKEDIKILCINHFTYFIMCYYFKQIVCTPTSAF